MKTDAAAYCAWLYGESDYTEGGLFDHLNSGGPFVMADLYTITLASGEVLRWADFDVDLEYGGWSYSSAKGVLQRGMTRCTIGVEVDTLDVSMYPRDGVTINGRDLRAAAVSGVFDGARLRLERAFLTPELKVRGALIMFVGRLADIDVDRMGVVERVNSPTELFAAQMPRNLTSPACSRVLYSTGCGVSRAAQTRGGTVMAGSTRTMLRVSIAQPYGWFALGYVVFPSGALAGVRRTIKASYPGVFELLLPLPALPAVGDVVEACPGCDHSKPTCANKFNNLARFRGYPYVPLPETAL